MNYMLEKSNIQFRINENGLLVFLTSPSSKFNLNLITKGSTKIAQWDDSHGEVNLQLLDAIGRTIWSSFNIQANSAQLPTLIPGNYILSAYDKKGNRGKVLVPIN